MSSISLHHVEQLLIIDDGLEEVLTLSLQEENVP